MWPTYRSFLPPFWITISAFGCCRLFTWEQTNDIIRSKWRRVDNFWAKHGRLGLCTLKSNTCILSIKNWNSDRVEVPFTFFILQWILRHLFAWRERKMESIVRWAILFEMPQKIWAVILGEACNLYSKLFGLFTRFGSSLCNEFLSSRVSRNIFHVGGGGGGGGCWLWCNLKKDAKEILLLVSLMWSMRFMHEIFSRAVCVDNNGNNNVLQGWSDHSRFNAITM